MPPSSQRRVRTRKQNEPQDRSDVDDSSFTTPTRKRRRINTNDTPNTTEAPLARDPPRDPLRRAKTREDDIKNLDDTSIAQEDVDSVIRNLRQAKYEIQARVDFANEVHEVAHPEGKQAYAKIAGNGWTFYVDDLEVRIGRPPEERQYDGDQAEGGQAKDDKSLVHIDLGPSKLVSRQHAEIRYDENNGSWYISVNGRNGIKLDEEPFGRGQTAILRSGSVIDVAGTQMMFVTPNDVPSVHPAIQAQASVQRDEDDEEDDDVDHYQPAPRIQRTPPHHSSRSAANNHSASRDAYSNQPYKASQQSNTKSSFSNIDGSADHRQSGSQAKVSDSPSYSRGVLLETTEDIDYSQDSAKDLKPPHSYAQLIGMAILSSDEEKLTLSKIYDWIKEHYAFYRFSGGGWQNSIRHNLSLNRSFEKIARRTDEPGKGMKWQIVPEQRDDFIKKGLNPRKPPGHGSSGPNSPLKEGNASLEHDRRHESTRTRDTQHDVSKFGNSNVKTSPGSTPPIGSYPKAKQAFTPDRGPNIFTQLHGPDASSPRSGFPAGHSPSLLGNRGRDRLNGLNEAAAAGSPGGPAMLIGSDPNDHLMTPLITKHVPKLAPPSTARLPSQFMPMSSPAPFWKYADFGSTPAHFGAHGVHTNLDISPEKGTKIKSGEKLEPDADDESKPTVNGKLAGVPSSSPPPGPGEVGQGSPTRKLGSRGKDNAQPQAQPKIEVQKEELAEEKKHLPKAEDQDVTLAEQDQVAPPPAQQTEEDGDDDEDEGMIDLARGFQPIGSFHRQMSGIRGN